MDIQNCGSIFLTNKIQFKSSLSRFEQIWAERKKIEEIESICYNILSIYGIFLRLDRMYNSAFIKIVGEKHNGSQQSIH